MSYDTQSVLGAETGTKDCQTFGKIFFGVMLGFFLAFMLMFYVFDTPIKLRNDVVHDYLTHPERYKVEVYHNTHTGDSIITVKYIHNNE